jgi:hypothetical protein
VEAQRVGVDLERKGNEVSDYLKVPAGEPVPLSHLELDLPSPVEGWPAFLAARGVEIVLDDIGRAAVSRADARRVLEEKRAAEQKARELAARNERQAIERDREFRSQLPRGVPWHRMPNVGVLPVEQMTAQAKAELPRRKSGAAAFLDGDSMVMHPIHEPLEDEL